MPLTVGKARIAGWSGKARERQGEFRLSPNAVKLLDELEETLTPGQLRAVKDELHTTPETMRKTYLLAVAGRSLTQAAKVLCMECSKWNRGRVRRCSQRHCVLWPYRGWKEKDDGPVR